MWGNKMSQQKPQKSGNSSQNDTPQPFQNSPKGDLEQYFRNQSWAIFMKVMITIVCCEAAIMASFHLFRISGIWAVILDPLILGLSAMALLIGSVVKPLEQSLIQSKANSAKLRLLRELLDNSSDCFFVIDPEQGRILDVNQRASEVLGYARHELLKMTIPDIEGKIFNQQLWQEHVKELRDHGHIILEGIHKCKDGSKFPVEVSVRYISRSGLSYMVAVARNITQRKNIEQSLNSRHLTPAISKN